MLRERGGELVFGAMGLVCPMAWRISALLAGGIITYKGAAIDCKEGDHKEVRGSNRHMIMMRGCNRHKGTHDPKEVVKGV